MFCLLLVFICWLSNYVTDFLCLRLWLQLPGGAGGRGGGGGSGLSAWTSATPPSSPVAAAPLCALASGPGLPPFLSTTPRATWGSFSARWGWLPTRLQSPSPMWPHVSYPLIRYRGSTQTSQLNRLRPVPLPSALTLHPTSREQGRCPQGPRTHRHTSLLTQQPRAVDSGALSL